MVVETSVADALRDDHTHMYTVPVVLQDCPPATALHQTFENLGHLDHILNDICDRMTKRIGEQRAQMATIFSRVAAAQQQIQTISQNEHRATTIFSSSKYPSDDTQSDFKRVCELTTASAATTTVTTTTTAEDGTVTTNTDTQPAQEQQQQQRHIVQRADHALKRTQRHEMTPMVDTSDLFTQFARTQALRSEIKTENDESDAATSGLGRLPAHLPSVCSILLFNSDENPYKTYNSLDNLEGVGGVARASADKSLAMAPVSILDGAELPSFGSLGMEDKPANVALPQFNTLANLPLPRLAADVSFQSSDVSIAPSNLDVLSLPSIESLTAGGAGFATTSKRAPGLPDTEAQPSSEAPRLEMDPALAAATPPPAPPAPSTASVPAAPPPVAVAAPAAPPAPTAPPAPADAAPAAPAASVPAAPPAPPAPSGPPPAGSLQPPAQPGDGGKGDLLAAIRKGKGLKKAADRVIKEKPKPKGGGGGDMMSALRERMAMRQKAISGKQDIVPQNKRRSDSSSGGSGMSKTKDGGMSGLPSLDMPESRSRHASEAGDEWDE